MELPPVPESLYQYASLAAAAGYRRISGIDEAGRGPLAGPVVAAAVILPCGLELDGLNDSKQVSEAERERLYGCITEQAEIEFAVAVIEPDVIDRVNILQATFLAMRQAAEQLRPDFIFVDGNPVTGLPTTSRNVIKGDAKCASIAAASIVAKVHRDRLMVCYDATYPGYGFARHKGYGTAQHLEALERLGPCPIHRRSFAPVARCLPGALIQADLELPQPADVEPA